MMPAPAANAFSPRPGQHDGARAIVHAELEESVAQFRERRDVEHSECLLAIDGDYGDSATPLYAQDLGPSRSGGAWV